MLNCFHLPGVFWYPDTLNNRYNVASTHLYTNDILGSRLSLSLIWVLDGPRARERRSVRLECCSGGEHDEDGRDLGLERDVEQGGRAGESEGDRKEG